MLQTIAILKKRIRELEERLVPPATPSAAENTADGRYRAIFERALDAIYILDMSGNFLDVNQTAIQLMGYSLEEALTLNFFDLVPDEQSGPAVRKLADPDNYDLYREPLEFRVRCKDGTWIWIETKAKVLFKDGVASELHGIAVDITERKRAQEALAQREEQYRAIFEAATDALFLFDFSGRLVALNPQAVSLYGYSDTELVGHDTFSMTPSDFHPLFHAFLEEVRSKGGYFAESIHPHKNGTPIHVEVHGTRFQYQGQPHILASIRNISERIRMEQDLLRQKTELEEKSRHLEETNTALKVLIRQRDTDREDMVRSMVTNVRELVLPYLEELTSAPLSDREHTLLETAASNLDAIASPFARKLTGAYHRLTPTEIRVANLIRHGRTTKEIAEIIGLSKGTIDFHRHNIREKLGIKKQKINLRTHLLTLGETDLSSPDKRMKHPISL